MFLRINKLNFASNSKFRLSELILKYLDPDIYRNPSLYPDYGGKLNAVLTENTGHSSIVKVNLENNTMYGHPN
jgi:hypothetical protein